MRRPEHGDVLIRTFVGTSLQVVDATTLEQICIVPSVDYGIKIGADQCVSVWRENLDARGKAAGRPKLLLRRKNAQSPTLASER